MIRAAPSLLAAALPFASLRPSLTPAPLSLPSLAPSALSLPAPLAATLSPSLAPRLAPAPYAADDAPRTPRRASTVTGDVRHIPDFPSALLGDRRDVRVYLPPGYETSGRDYPVLYVMDGQNVFDAATAFGGTEWGLDETLERLIRAGLMEPVIVVAVDNTPERLSHFSPVPDPEHGGGRADAYGRFLSDELKPYIDARLRTRTGPADTAILGSSLGGLLALHLSHARPELFGRAGALSPSLWWAGEELLARLASGAHAGAAPRLWADMGWREGSTPEARGANVRRLRRLASVLATRGRAEGAELALREYPEAGHHESAWAARAADVLRFLFPPR